MNFYHELNFNHFIKQDLLKSEYENKITLKLNLQNYDYTFNKTRLVFTKLLEQWYKKIWNNT